ncbi:hypothetical protein [Streptomyces kronopolitis]|uniref:hypothetical protein n=1 Tax=Streptomyces kronopolitis TaxID=1612435 RepID=UPI003D95F2A4
MTEASKRVPLSTPAASAAAQLGCYSKQVGPCVRACGGLTARYGTNARPVCPACRYEEAAAGAAQQRR